MQRIPGRGAGGDICDLFGRCERQDGRKSLRHGALTFTAATVWQLSLSGREPTSVSDASQPPRAGCQYLLMVDRRLFRRCREILADLRQPGIVLGGYRLEGSDAEAAHHVPPARAFVR